ncbi:hypothetical protein WN51_06610, partial [Melipona quadrifasciata]
NVAHNKLIRKCKEKYPAANKEFITKKIYTMRCNFQREFKKVQSLKRSGNFADDVYVPKLYYIEIHHGL